MGPFVMFGDRVDRRRDGNERDNPFPFGFGRRRIADNVTQIHIANYHEGREGARAHHGAIRGLYKTSKQRVMKSTDRASKTTFSLFSV